MILAAPVSKPMTEWQIQRRLYYDGRASYSVLLPNYTPPSWYECDMFGVTQAGYFVEFEIKLTVADFRADLKKGRNFFGHTRDEDADYMRPTMTTKNKHEQLAAGDEAGPKRFWYVVPADLITAEDVPSYAGLLYIDEPGEHLVEIKPAPDRHKAKVSEKVVNHALHVCYARYWQVRLAKGIDDDPRD